jgi:uncharacterized protein (DUF1697 family)
MASRHVALLRGINVGRAKRVAMADLRAMVEDLGYREVRTVLNGGNVVLTGGREAPDRIGGRIERAMAERLGVPAAVTALSAATFATVVKENTLAPVASDSSRLLVAFCQDAGRLRQVEALERQDWGEEALAVGHAAAYLWCPAGILASRLTEAVYRALGSPGTMRNWSTVRKIHAAL